MAPYYPFIKYLLVGALVVAVNLTALYLFTEFAHIYYLVSTVLAFFVSFLLSFVLQKFWTFKHTAASGNARRQVPLYLALQLCNVSLNTGAMYIFVQYLHIWYLLSQAIISLVLAIGIFFINKHYIFPPAAEPVSG